MSSVIRDWPYGFLDEFWDLYNGRDEKFLPPWIIDKAELIGSVEYVLATSKISNREKTVIRQHFQKKQSYKEIGMLYNLSTSRVREIARRGMYRIGKNTKHKAILSMGVTAYARHLYKTESDTVSEEIIKNRIREARLSDCRHFAKKYNQNENELKMRVCAAFPIKKKAMKLSDLDLSVRTYNALRRSGHNTTDDILEHESKKELMEIRNFGEQCFLELMKELKKKEYDVQHFLTETM